MKETTDKPPVTEIVIYCPNCDMGTPAVYDTNEKRPSLYGQCPFCATLWRWRKSSTVEIVPATRKQYTYGPDNLNRPTLIKDQQG